MRVYASSALLACTSPIMELQNRKTVLHAVLDRTLQLKHQVPAQAVRQGIPQPSPDRQD
jgi:hypothetical protein